MDADDLQGGGGSGGTIAISTYRLQGKAILSVHGGAASQSSSTSTGGAGSGGRIKILRFGWHDSQFFRNDESLDYSTQTKLTMITNGGNSSVGDGRSASVWSTPCPPGYSGPTCSACPNGTYSNDIFGNYCSPCNNMPMGALGYYNTTAWNNTSCPYECDEGITPISSNKYCLGTFDLFLNQIGGVVIFVIMIISTLLVVLLVIYFLSETNKSKSIDKLIELKNKELEAGGGDDLNNLKVLHQEFKFFDRDVYQHFSRIYFLGSNDAIHPWKMPVNPPITLRPRIIFERYVEFANSINQ
jgi:hypothetical protein